MARPVFIADDLAGAEPGTSVVLGGAEAHHAARVVRLRSGESVDVVDGRGRRVEGTVADVGRAEVSIVVVKVIDEQPATPRFVVVQALAKGDRGERAVETLTEVGVDVIVPWAATHAVSQWKGDKADRGVDKWRAAARAAAKQARRSRVPEVRALADTAHLRGVVESATLALVLDEDASDSLSQVDVPMSGDVVVIVGPEGGITDVEREAFASWGARAVHLGPSIMRTSTAGTVAAGVLLARTDRWR